MTKRQLFLIAGTLVVAACGNYTGVCETAGYSQAENHNRDQIGEVECRNTDTDRATAPAPKVTP